MNTAETMGGNGALGRRRRRYLRSTMFDIYDHVTQLENPKFIHFYTEAIIKRLYKCLL